MFFVFSASSARGRRRIKRIAFALAIGVAFDAFLVRMTLVPAAMALAGTARLVAAGVAGPRLPDVDIEGTSLQKATPADDKEPQRVS